MTRMLLCLFSVALLTMPVFASNRYLLPVKDSDGRSVLYFADHKLQDVDTKAEYAVVMVHGVNGGREDCTGRVRRIMGAHASEEKVFFVAPCFPVESQLNDAAKNRNVYWETDRWQAGHDSPVAKNLSPYDVLDSVFALLNDAKLYPRLKHVLFCGYSAGAQVVSRYMAVARIKSRKGLSFSFAAGAPSSWLFLDGNVGWHYGLKARNRYARQVSDSTILKNIKSRHIVCFCGTADTEGKNLSTTSRAMNQGANRYERFKNFRRHILSFKELSGSFEFFDVADVGHSGECWERIDFARLVFGPEGNTMEKKLDPMGTQQIKYGKSWQKTTPEACGFSSAKLAEIPGLIKSRNMGTTGLMVIVGGKEMYAYGDVEQISYIASCRKSVLSMLYGKYVRSGTIKLDETVGGLGIDDLGGLLPSEKLATVRDLITARSGCYHPASEPGGIPEGTVLERGVTEHGTKFVYNNWDFNVAGTVFEMKTRKSIYKVFDKDFAKPLMLQDWDLSRHKRSGDASKSVHLAYHFRLSTRDMARLGELMLRKGRWNGKQLIPADWVEESTRPVTSFPNGGGYGYMWWIESDDRYPDACRGAFAAHGMYGQRISVFPALDMVVAHKSAKNGEHPTRAGDYRELIRLIISAAHDRPNGRGAM